MARKFELEGLDDILKTLDQIGKLPQKCVTRAAKSGAQIVLRDARANAPKDTGALRKGIVLKAEKTKKTGKKVYQVTFSEKYNDVFVKETKNGKRYYYPASQEYGFITRDGKKVEGKHFMRNAMDRNKTQIEKTMVETLASEIDKLR